MLIEREDLRLDVRVVQGMFSLLCFVDVKMPVLKLDNA
jgi:hypothetical protein